jgi:peptide/nickel transport system permease protein
MDIARPIKRVVKIQRMPHGGIDQGGLRRRHASAEQPQTKSVLAMRQTWQARGLPPLLPLLVVGLLVFCALFAPLLAPHSPIEGSLGKRLIPPLGMEGSSLEHMLGTDRLGRDTLSRLIYGAQISLSVSLVGILLTGAVGASIGLLAGFWGAWVDTICMRLVDISLSLPGILMAVLLSVVFKPSFTNVVIVVIFLLWPSYARLVRGETLSLKQQEFVALARVAGCSSLTIMCRHLLPNLAPSILVLATLQVGFVIVLEASLSFIGVGIPPPTPSWGVMVADGRGLIEQAWWISILPGLAILVTVISLNILGDWVRDRLDPKLRQQ